MKSYIDDEISICLENGIVYVDYLIEHATYEIADKAIKKKLEMFTGESYPVISDMTKIKSSTRDARQRMSEPDAAIGVKAVAIIFSSKVHRVMFNFFSAINKRPAPAKLFSNKEDAKKWAQKFIDIK